MHHSQGTTGTCIILLGVVIVSPSFARADGGTVRLSEAVGSYRVSLFTSPVPFRAGLVDISVMVQDAANSRPIPEARITLKMWPLERPSEAIIQKASATAATNKLLEAAVFELPEPGWWELHVTIEGPLGHAEAHCQVEAAEPWPPWLTLFPWIAWPVLPIALFGIHLILARRRSDCTA
ncbi:MAG TPA: hypothetical protein VGP68_09315 [Gemmataceae bacterium]|jgi:hypothetical protein|nr:hypothetical protein [Gemmataceae bacterium]